MQWRKLDNAAKIFPSTGNKLDTKVFRFACELKEMVDGDILQQALDRNMELFPMFSSVLKRGFFWYYLETSNIHAIARVEDKLPCSPIYDNTARELLFRVTFYKKRINFEVYHVLTDGTGALQFLRVLVYHYLLLKYPQQWKENLPLMDYDVSETQKTDDSFQKYYSGKKILKSRKVPFAYKLRGAKNSENRIKIIEGIVPSKAIMQKAKEYHVSVTVLLGSLFLLSVYKNMRVRDLKKPVVLTIPVNLRNFFDSRSERNFFSVVKIGYQFSWYPDDLESVLQYMGEALKNELTTERLEERISTLLSLEQNMLIRAMPLVVKDIVLKWVNKFQERGYTLSLSNVGRVNMPEEMKKYIRLFDVFIGTNKLQICMCSFEDNMTISFTSCFVSTEIQKEFFRMITDMGISVEIVSNQV